MPHPTGRCSTTPCSTPLKRKQLTRNKWKAGQEFSLNCVSQVFGQEHNLKPHLVDVQIGTTHSASFHFDLTFTRLQQNILSRVNTAPASTYENVILPHGRQVDFDDAVMLGLLVSAA